MNKKHIPKPLIAIILIALASTGYYFSLDRSTNTSYYGEIEPNTYDIYSMTSGIVTEITVSEGDSIEKGTIVAKIEADEAILKHEKSNIAKEISDTQLKKITSPAREEEINIQLATIDQLVKQKSSLNSSIEKARLGFNQSMLSSDTLKSTMDLKTDMYNDVKALYEAGSETKSNLDQAELALTGAKNSYESSVIQTKSIQKEINSLVDQSSSLDSQIQAARERLNILTSGADTSDRTISELNDKLTAIDTEIAKLYLDRYGVKSYIDGIVDVINYDIGEFVNIGAPVITMYDPNKISTKIYVSEKDLLNLEVGMELKFTLSSEPNVTMTGTVKRISHEAIFTPMNVVVEKDRDRLVFEVEVDLEPVNGVKPGMLVKTNLN